MTALAYLGLILFIVIMEALRKKQSIFDFLLFFNIMFCLMYAFPGFYLAAHLGGENLENNWFFEIDVYNIHVLAAIYLGYFSILLGFHSRSAEKHGKSLRIQWKDDKTILRIAISFLLLSTLTIQIYSMPFGGVISAISRATHIRIGAAEEEGPLGFFKLFNFLSYISTYLFASFIFFKGKNYTLLHGILLYVAFLASLLNSVIAVTITGGRAYLIYIFLFFYLTYIIRVKKIPWLLTLVLLGIAIPFVLNGKVIFYSLSALGDGFNAVLERFQENSIENASSGLFGLDALVSNFIFPLYSLHAAFNEVFKPDYTPRLLIDWLYAILTFLPERLLNITDLPETIGVFNTKYILGSLYDGSYGIPPGILAYGIYVYYWPGLMLVCFIYGWIGRYLETFFYNNISNTPWLTFFYVISAQVWIDYFAAGDPRVFLFADFWAFIGFSILLIFGSKLQVNNLAPLNRSSQYTKSK